MSASRTLPPEWKIPARRWEQDAATVARELVGMRLESTIGGVVTGGVIVETEAYLGLRDPASHAYRGRLNRSNRSIYSPPGTWYVYLSYGVHWCLNMVTGPSGEGAAVLIRAIIPDTGVESMISRRRVGSGGKSGITRMITPAKLTDGPGKLAQALGIDQRLDGVPMTESAVRIVIQQRVADREVAVTPRIGISKAVDWQLRFVRKGGAEKVG